MKKVFLISGHMRTGKNQLAEYLSNQFREAGFITESDLFAGPLKDWCKEDFKKLGAVLKNIGEEIRVNTYSLMSLQNEVFNPEQFKVVENSINKLNIDDQNWYENKTNITRNILQLYGTEIFRNRVDNDWWAKKLCERIGMSKAEVIFVTDVRFPNEIEALSYNTSFEYEVYTIRVERTINTGEMVATHASETSLDDWKNWDFVVMNDGTLEDLRVTAKAIKNWILEKKKESGYINYFTKQKSGLLT